MLTKYQQFKPYTDYLTSLVIRNQSGAISNEAQTSIAAALDGECSKELRNTVSLEVRRKDGVFFTGSSLSEIAIQNKLNRIQPNSIFYDPACGAGDLLISIAKVLPIEQTLEKTLISWGKKLVGRDLNPIFVNAARSRIALIAIQRGAKAKNQKRLRLKELLPNIKTGDGLKYRDYKKVTHILMNPPFNMIQTKEKYPWIGGGVNSAAVFVDQCIKNAKSGTRLIAILPDVLRSGSRYELWRKEFNLNAFVNDIELYGRFDRCADVDVFVLDATITSALISNSRKWKNNKKIKNKKTVGKNYLVHIGPVVPFRNKGLGRWYPYIHAKNLEPWGKTTKVLENIRFNGTVFKPPFVVIKRTSRHGDEHRAVAMIISGKKPVAVENHLIVCIPNNGTVAECTKLVTILRSKKVTCWLNERIRCRHLTVTAVKDIPI